MSAGDHTGRTSEFLGEPIAVSINLEVVDTLPEIAKRSARDSVSRDIVIAAKGASPQYVKVSADNPEELVRIYKSLIQFKTRYRTSLRFEMRKAGESIFVWVPNPQEAAA